MKHDILTEAIGTAANDGRWRKRLRTLIIAASVVMVSGIAAVGVAGYYLVSATTAAVQSPEVKAAGAEALARMASISQGFPMQACVDEITAHLNPSVWIERPIAESLAALKQGCLGGAPAAPAQLPPSTATPTAAQTGAEIST